MLLTSGLSHAGFFAALGLGLGATYAALARTDHPYLRLGLDPTGGRRWPATPVASPIAWTVFFLARNA